jgi:hypothetical protein
MDGFITWASWFRVNHEEGKVQNLYSTNEFTSTELNGKSVFEGDLVIACQRRVSK